MLNDKNSLTVLLCSISEGLFRYSSSGEIFEQPKPDYEEALKKCGYKEKLCKTSKSVGQENLTSMLMLQCLFFNRLKTLQ